MGERQILGTSEAAIVVPGEKLAYVMVAIGALDLGLMEGETPQVFLGEGFDIVPITSRPKRETGDRGESLTDRTRELLENAVGQIDLVQNDIARADDDFKDRAIEEPISAALEADHAVAGIVATRIANALEELRYALEAITWGAGVKASLTHSENAARRAAPTSDGRQQEEF